MSALTRTKIVDTPAEEADLFVEDEAVEVLRHGGVVIAGLGSTIFAHPGVTVDVENGGTVHLAPGALLLEERPGALERGDITVCDWLPTTTRIEVAG